MVGPVTNIAPFGSFWQEEAFFIQSRQNSVVCMTLYFVGCQKYTVTKLLNLFLKAPSHIAFSRRPGKPKDLLSKFGADIYRTVHEQRGYFYVCGEVAMGEGVKNTLQRILKEFGSLSDEEADSYMLRMRDENRYCEDIFGITYKATVRGQQQN